MPRAYHCINLDDMSRGELVSLDASTLHPLQAKYAHDIYNAKSLRLQGHIAEAMAIEKKCDALYARMPAGLRW